MSATPFTASHIGNLQRFFKALKVYLNTLLQPKLKDVTVLTTGGVVHPNVTEAGSGAIYVLNNAADQTFTLPKAAPVGFHSAWYQKAGGQVKFTAEAGGSVVPHTASHDGSLAAGSRVTLEVTENVDGASALWRLAGDTATVS
jgi:hypothetical protein